MGTDLIEIGMPFTDPMAEGPPIQASYLRALEGGQTMKKTLDLVRQFRADDATTPIVLMGYYNPVYHYGVEKFLSDAKTAGVDGFIIVDLPAEEDEEMCLPPLKPASISSARDTDHGRAPAARRSQEHQRLRLLCLGQRYYGAAAANTTDVSAAVARIKAETELPVAVGFALKRPKMLPQLPLMLTVPSLAPPLSTALRTIWMRTGAPLRSLFLMC